MTSTIRMKVLGLLGAALLTGPAGCSCGTEGVVGDADGDADADGDTDTDTGQVACQVDADCDDGVFCNGAETCLAGRGCVPGRALLCDDGIECTVDSCDAKTDACLQVAVHERCDDGRSCNGAESCDAATGCVVEDLPECDDGVPCTWDTCEDATGGCVNVPMADRCANGVFCDGVERCDAELDCVDGTPPLCTDGVDCTADACDAGLDECASTPVDARCDDGRICNGVETCDVAGGCVVEDIPDCDDLMDCTWDTCDDATGDCVNVPLDVRCDDADVCTGTEVCDPDRGCVSRNALDCTDPYDCTADTCDPVTGCANTPDDALCSDGAFCNGVEECRRDYWGAYFCTGGPPPDCDDADACTSDSCDPAADGGAGACVGVLRGEVCATGADEDCDGEIDEADCVDLALFGAYRVQDGPPWWDNPPTYTCLEACALVFGGVAGDYQCSTSDVVVDNLANASSWGDGCSVVAEDYKLNAFYDCGVVGCSTSAYVLDWCFSGETNFCWR